MRRSTLTLFCAVLVLLMALSGNVHASKMIPKEQKPQKKKANKETEMMKGKLSKKVYQSKFANSKQRFAKEKNTSEAEPVCAWDKYYKECFVRPQPTINALFDTKKEFATIVGRALVRLSESRLSHFGFFFRNVFIRTIEENVMQIHHALGTSKA